MMLLRMQAACIYISLIFVLINIGASYAIRCGSGRPPCPDRYDCKLCKRDPRKGTCVPLPPADCLDALNVGYTTSGVYSVTTWLTKTQIDVYCDMDTDGGGWTVFQRRIDGNLNFSRNWAEYEDGFGDVNFEHWLGLRYIKEMAGRGDTRLRFHLTDVNDTTVYRQFNDFGLSSGLYDLHIDTASGDSPPSSFASLFYHNGMAFSTFDSDNDLSGNNCAGESGGGGWWYNRCYLVNFNGVYATPGTSSVANNRYQGIVHRGFTEWIAYKSSTMMFRLI